jgi:diguanylate cyclase (GGDEF)-like protein
VTSSGIADPQVELVVAEAELMIARGEWQRAAAHLEASLPLVEEGLRPPGRPKGESPSAQHDGSQISARVRCLFYEVLAAVLEHLGASAPALQSLRRWQQLHVERARRASLARQQAASLKTELMRLERERDLIEQRRRDSERAKGALQAINQQLSQKIAEVDALRVALQRQAVRDFLTGLFNRRHLNDVLPSMLALAQREQQPLALAIIDLDHFKAINDHHGHLTGDRLLAEFGRLLDRRLRKSDIACRYGGEEFCILMPRTTAQAASRKLGSLLRAWRGEVFTHEDRVLAGNCFSAGVADSLQAPQSTDTLLRAADQCVLQAKRLGRNRVIAYEPDANAPP